jgi:hypothetical protein
MEALRDTLLILLLGLIVIAIAGDELARFANEVALPLAGLLVAIVVARLVWFYTSRW